MLKFLLKIYTAGNTPKIERAIASMHHICKDELKGQYRVVVIDIQRRPQLVESERILALPDVLDTLPLSLQDAISSMSNGNNPLLGLDIMPYFVQIKEGETVEL